MHRGPGGSACWRNEETQLPLITQRLSGGATGRRNRDPYLGGGRERERERERERKRERERMYCLEEHNNNNYYDLLSTLLIDRVR